MHISAPTNHQKELPWQEILTCIKQYGKTEIKNTMKNTYAVFLRYEILKVQWRINVVEYCYSLYQFILPSENSYCYFHIVFMCLALYFPMFTLHIPCFPFLSFFLKLKNIFLLFSTFWKWSYKQRCFDVNQCYETRRWK